MVVVQQRRVNDGQVMQRVSHTVVLARSSYFRGLAVAVLFW